MSFAHHVLCFMQVALDSSTLRPAARRVGADAAAVSVISLECNWAPPLADALLLQTPSLPLIGRDVIASHRKWHHQSTSGKLQPFTFQADTVSYCLLRHILVLQGLWTRRLIDSSASYNFVCTTKFAVLNVTVDDYGQWVLGDLEDAVVTYFKVVFQENHDKPLSG